MAPSASFRSGAPLVPLLCAACCFWLPSLAPAQGEPELDSSPFRARARSVVAQSDAAGQGEGTAQGPPASSAGLRLAVEYPRNGAEVRGPDRRGFVTGRAYQARAVLGEFDVYVVIDVSDSTRRPSGADIDGDGRVGEASRASSFPIIGGVFDPSSDDPGDSVLACEVKAAKTLLAQLDRASTRVGIISFAGDFDVATPDAVVLAPLTNDYDSLIERLDELERTGPRGETNLLSAVQRVTFEFERDFLRNRDRDVRRLALLISDGRATLPLALQPGRRARAAVEAAADAVQVQATIYTYAVGKREPLYLDTLEEIATVTRGVHEVVDQPEELVARFQNLDLAEIASVTVRNLTTEDRSDEVLIDPYGVFAAMVPLAVGENLLEVFARSTSGEERREKVRVVYVPDEGLAALPARALERRGRLLKERLIDLYTEEIQRTRERDRQRREARRGLDVRVDD